MKNHDQKHKRNIVVVFNTAYMLQSCIVVTF